MPKNTLQLGHIIGVPVIISSSWFIIYFLVGWSLYVGYFTPKFPETTPLFRLLASGGTSGIFFVTILLHEVGHVAMAQRYGIATRRILLFVLGGMAELTEEPKTAKSEFAITLAGPLTSLGIALLFLGASVLFRFLHTDLLVSVTALLASMNGVMGIFNLIPGYPLDGGRVVRALLWHITRSYRRATKIATVLAQSTALILAGWGLVSVTGGDYAHGLWLIMVGGFINTASTQQYRHTIIKDTLRHVTVEQVITATPIKSPSVVQSSLVPVVYPTDSVASVLKTMHAHEVNTLTVVQKDNPVGVVTEGSILHYLRGKGIAVS